MSLNKTTQLFFEKLKGIFEQSPAKPLELTSIQEYRDNGKALFTPFAGTPADICAKSIIIPTSTGMHLSAIVFEPEIAAPLPTLIFYPGGGFIANLEVHHVPCSKIAKYANCRVIMVNTPLAPENKFPIGINAAYEAYQWVIKNSGILKVEKDKIMIGGDSSGGNFAALVAIKARDEHLKLAHQFLISPATDLSRTIKTHTDYERYDMLLSPELADWAYKHYLPVHINSKDPTVSPYWCHQLHNLAPATIIVAEHDGLRSDAEGYYKKLLSAGNDCELIVCPGQVHSFMIARGVLNEGLDPANIIAEKIITLFGK